MKYISASTRNRVYVCFLFLASILLLFTLRIGYMQFIYQQDIVTVAQMKQTVSDLNEPLIEEVSTHFGINLDGYEKIEMDQLIINGNPGESVLSLIDLISEACQSGCAGKPVVYLQNGQGYLLYKDAAGGNVLSHLSKEGERWRVAKVQ